MGYVLIRGKKAPILGRVCMDQFMVDVSHIPDVEVLDLVTLIGKDGDEEITLEDLGELSGRFNFFPYTIFFMDSGDRKNSSASSNIEAPAEYLLHIDTLRLFSLSLFPDASPQPFAFSRFGM